MEGVIAIGGFFTMIVAIVVVPIWLRERTKQSAHHLISQALEKGQTLDPALMERLTQTTAKPLNTPRRTLGNGIVLLALAIGFAAASYSSSGDFDPSGHAMGGMMTAALILGALGIAFTVLAIVDYSTKKKDA